MSKISHPDAARLLAWVDHELNPLSAWRVGRHVGRCWHCRGRVAVLETAIRSVGQVLEPAQVDAVDVAKARWKFREAAAEWEASREPRSRRPVLSYALAGAAAALCVAAIAWRAPAPRESTRPTAASLLLSALDAETPVIRAAVREEHFSVEYGSGAESLHRRDLLLLASPGRSAWTARWSTQDGELQAAVFAGDAQEFTKASGLRPAVYRKSDVYKGLFGRVSSGRQDIEPMILRWITDQVWQPVSFAREVAEFCSRSGAVLRISTSGTAVLWTAESTLNGISISVHLEGLRGQAPAVLRVAWHSLRGNGIVRIKRESSREHNDLQRAGELLYAEALAPRPAKAGPKSVPQPARLPAPGPALRELLASEVGVMQALHRARLCKGDQVQVTRAADAIHVSGSFAGEEQVERVAALLSGIPHLRIRLATLAPSSEPSLRPAESPVEPETRPAAAESWLRARLGVGVRTSEREMFNTMNAIVRDSEDLLSNSWALHRLSRRFPAEIEREMDDKTRAAVHQMADDHIEGLNVHLALIGVRLGLPQVTPPALPQTAAWQQEADALHEQARQTGEVLLNLFTSVENPRTPPAADPEQAGMASMIGRVRSMAAQVRARLNTEPQAASQ